MLTIFSIPKPFIGHIGVIQRNAITSWTLLRPRPEVIIFGDEEGIQEICQSLGIRHVPNIARNEFGTPLLNDVFEKAKEMATDQLCYVNADILLMNDFMLAVRRVAEWRRPALLVGRRCDLDITEPLRFGDSSWEANLRTQAECSGTLRPTNWIDYFVFPNSLFEEIPPFAIGRTVWDNWLIWYAAHRGAVVVDATPSVLAIHQNHDYSHVVQGEDGIWKGEEARRNEELMGGPNRQWHIMNANFVLTPQGIRRAWGKPYRKARFKVWRRAYDLRARALRHAIGLDRKRIESFLRVFK